MDRFIGKVAVVTGASAGIGEAIVKALVKSGMRVVGLARRKSKLESLGQSLRREKGEFHACECDVANEQSVKDAFQWVKKTFGAVHALVNNAGIFVDGFLIDMEAENFKKVFDTNVLGLLHCTQQALRIMRDGNIEGTIININSIQGHRVHRFPGIQMNVYPGSKHAVSGIVDGLHHELRDKNLKVRVTSISPGFVMTEMVTETDCSMDEIRGLPHLQPEDIAGAVSYVLSTPHHVQITELTIRPLGENY